MTKSLIHRVIPVLLMLTPVIAHAEKELSFSYLQASYISSTVNLGGSVDDIEGDGFGFALSLGLNPHLALTLSVLSATFRSFQGIDVDTSKMTDLGLTAHTTIAPSTYIYANLSATKAEITLPDGTSTISNDDFGSVFSVGLRYLALKNLELEASGSNTDVFDTTTFSYNLNARLYYRKVYSLGLGYVSSDNADSFLVNVRMDI